MKAQKFILGYYGMLFLGFGLAGLTQAEALSHLVHFNIDAPGARMEFISTYGGLFLGFGGFLLYCLKDNIHIGLLSVLFTMGAMLIARVIGFMLYGGADMLQYIYLAGEAFTLVLLGFLLVYSGSPSKTVQENQNQRPEARTTV